MRLKTPPSKPTRREEHFSFRVWAHDQNYAEQTKPYCCVGQFYYFGDALKYLDSILGSGCKAWLQTPCGVEIRNPETCSTQPST